MNKTFKHVYQFKITLAGTQAPIWRRIQVPEIYTFWDLHVAIQDSMGWLDYHLHEFAIKNPSINKRVRIGIPDPDFDDSEEVLPDWAQKIAAYFTMENKKAKYVYDFGDDWEHSIQLEKILPKQKGIDYPICITGKGKCPPEDCGGIVGFEEILKKTHPFQKEYDYNYDDFDPKEVMFDDPEERWKQAFEGGD